VVGRNALFLDVGLPDRFSARNWPLTRPPPSGTLSPGRGLPYLQCVEAMKIALSRGERVARCRRFHQPERAG
jgi:hypothetical protein